jgi:hypothetical protein
MPFPTTTRQWILQRKPEDVPILFGENSTFKLTITTLPHLQDDQVLLKSLWISNDPAQRTWISSNVNPDHFYKPTVNIGEPMRAKGVAEVLESRMPGVSKGTYVVANTNWTEYSVRNWKDCLPIENIPDVNITHHLGALSFPGLSAYNGLTEIGKISKDSSVVISTAAGATGSMAVQIAKNMIGCKRVC